MSRATNVGDRVALQGRVGLALVGLSWSASWLHVGMFGEVSFFPLWLGYVLVVDAIVLHRIGSSLLTRGVWRFVGMFVASMPLWWAFEPVNLFTENWRYLGVDHYSSVQYAILASVNFSIVVPAVFETAELTATFGIIDRFRDRARLPGFRWAPLASLTAGVAMVWSIVLWPAHTFPLIWIGMILALDPVNHVRGRASVTHWLQRGEWRPIVSLAFGALICGWFWEMWNQWAYPKWVYDVPPFDFLHIWEMPLLGYGGYLPFGLEVFVAYHFLMGLVRGGWSWDRPGEADSAVTLLLPIAVGRDMVDSDD